MSVNICITFHKYSPWQTTPPTHTLYWPHYPSQHTPHTHPPCTHTHTYTHIYTHTHIHTHTMHTYTYTHIHTLTHLHSPTHTYPNGCTSTHTYIPVSLGDCLCSCCLPVDSLSCSNPSHQNTTIPSRTIILELNHLLYQHFMILIQSGYIKLIWPIPTLLVCPLTNLDHQHQMHCSLWPVY